NNGCDQNALLSVRYNLLPTQYTLHLKIKDSVFYTL
ncbi:hypothetical protein BMETH_345711091651, partial [methanotrophic bacterial endosymbiont of Bathymodiolus sp.]